MSSSGVVSKKLKFKGDKPKKKKRHHHHEDDGDELGGLAAGDPRGWVFPEDVMEVSGPAFIVLPTEPLTCLAWDAQRQKVYAAPLDLPEAPEGAAELSEAEILAAIEPSAVNQVWVVSRLSGSESVISLRTSTGTFLTAHPSGTLSATTPSRGPLESFVPILTPSSSSSSSSSLFPTLSLQTNAEKYLSAPPTSSAVIKSGRAELRADADVIGPNEGFRVKCQREFVLKARVDKAGGAGDGDIKGKSRIREGGGSVEDEMRRNREAQAWGAGRAVVSDQDRREVKRAKKEGRLAEAMLDRRAALKSDRYAK
ncbi:hypothetical protein BCR39DRAFT_513483 [Naematelia encephala]|uniref:FRG1-like family-domain-containing protein n=1 Tax=Naematelia encephala TaxID=71784 RepID=A0A1Y2BIG0_9TREE|nr:hypothetical protein BCR39DRAFT_513483 [Naematelia encephala]